MMGRSSKQQRIHRSREQWQALLDQYERSGLSPRAFCQQWDLSYGTFSRWRRRLLSDQDDTTLPASPDLFVELANHAESPAAASWDVELQLGENTFLRLRHQPC